MKKLPIILIVSIFFIPLLISWGNKAYQLLAVDDEFTIIKGTPTVLDVLANDNIPVGSSAKITSVTQPKHGRVIINPDSTTLTYIPFKHKRVNLKSGKKIDGSKKIYIGHGGQNN